MACSPVSGTCTASVPSPGSSSGWTAPSRGSSSTARPWSTSRGAHWTRSRWSKEKKTEKIQRKNNRFVTTPGPRVAPALRVITAPRVCLTSGGQCACASPGTGGDTAGPGTRDNLATQVWHVITHIIIMSWFIWLYSTPALSTLSGTKLDLKKQKWCGVQQGSEIRGDN